MRLELTSNGFGDRCSVPIKLRPYDARRLAKGETGPVPLRGTFPVVVKPPIVTHGPEAPRVVKAVKRKMGAPRLSGHTHPNEDCFKP